MSHDGNLRSVFRKHVKNCFWQPIETWAIAAGVPDSFYCFKGGSAQGWIEHKLAVGKNCFSLRPGQLPWAKQYRSYGGNYFLAVRRQKADVDQLWVLGADEITQDYVIRAKGELFGRLLPHHLHFDGGPGKWDWNKVIKAMHMSVDEFSFLSFTDGVNSSSTPAAAGKLK